MKLYFNINYHTKLGERIELLVYEDNQIEKIYQLTYTDNGNWQCEIDYFSKSIEYSYQLVDQNDIVLDKEILRHFCDFVHNYQEYRVYDSWNLKNFPENYLGNKILKNQLNDFKPEKISILKKHSHLFRIKAPIYNANWVVVILGNSSALGEWSYDKSVKMTQVDYGEWEVAVTIEENQFIQYKYGIFDKNKGEVISVEYGKDRWALPNSEEQILQIHNDHYYKFKSDELYHAAGVAIPVFSLRSESGLGIGEFLDLKKLADWAKKTNLSIIQTLPINDTTANYSWTDSYPYAPISLYALHPIYISIENLDYQLPKSVLKEYEKLKEQLNEKAQVDYPEVIKAKWNYLKLVYNENQAEILKDKDFKKFRKENEEWLRPYVAFCYLRDKYKTPDYLQWKTHKKYIPGKLSSLFNEKNKAYNETMLHIWVQYQLHKQLSEAVDYAHSLGISLKGDLPIGIYRYSVEAWTEPNLYGLDFQAGAPPDQFSELGQNWGFPTYNWEAMKDDGYRWWKNRFKALEKYFDAMRIDHILGFFRIWRMPESAVQGILGYFYPSVPITQQELDERHINLSHERLTNPFITDSILWSFFQDSKEEVAERFLENHFNGHYSFKEEFNTQKKVQNYFKQFPNSFIEEKLYSLLANVLFLIEERNGEVVYHPRFNMQKTASFDSLGAWEKSTLNELYHNYFFVRQDELWKESALEKLPQILNSSKMLICGEDLGMVPNCVPEVMDSLAITALKVQRMPPDNSDWYDPKGSGYMNVVTSSSHDSSTLRQWWEEDRELTQKYFNYQLNQWGTAPSELVPELAETIMLQHLYNEAMLAIFPIQEFLATDYDLRSEDKDVERINVPAIFPHYWRYRMHLTLEDLNSKDAFNNKIAFWIKDSKRAVN